MREGDILLFEGNAWYSKIIQYLTDSPYSHAALYVGDGLIVEADWDGVNVRPLEPKYTPSEATIYRHRSMSLGAERYLVQWAVSQSGAGYDYAGLLGILMAMVGKARRNPFDDKKRYWCSELCMDAYRNAGASVDCSKDTWRVSPGDISRDKNFYQVKNDG